MIARATSCRGIAALGFDYTDNFEFPRINLGSVGVRFRGSRGSTWAEKGGRERGEKGAVPRPGERERSSGMKVVDLSGPVAGKK